jgi:hypothetical protein
MAATEAPAAVPAEAPAETVAKDEKLSKVDKPDEEKFKKDIGDADKQLNAVSEKLVSFWNQECY